MPKVIVIDREGVRHVIEAKAGLPLMFVLRDAGLPVEGTCGGSASCGSCHVFLSNDWAEKLSERSSAEDDLLKLFESYDPYSSRLSCQIEIADSLDGLTITLAPEEA